MPHTIIFSTSLNPQSRSRILAREAYTRLQIQSQQQSGNSVEFYDLQEHRLPLYGDACTPEQEHSLAQIRASLQKATHVIFAVPIYNFDASGAGKNLMEYLGEAEIGGRTVGFLCAAGGQSSYMSILGFANSLMLDFRCWIVPRFVYATGKDFEEDTLKNPDVSTRIDQLLTEMVRP
jgi:NAD(P)H-dependent FMN reductase